MSDVQISLNEKKHGGFFVEEDGKQIAEMVVSVSGTAVTVFHTEVQPEAEGKGYAKKLLDAMVAYARNHQLKVIPLCPYVLAQFKRHPSEFEDVWLYTEEDYEL